MAHPERVAGLIIAIVILLLDIGLLVNVHRHRLDGSRSRLLVGLGVGFTLTQCLAVSWAMIVNVTVESVDLLDVRVVVITAIEATLVASFIWAIHEVRKT